MVFNPKFISRVVFLLTLFGAAGASALPFNSDMVDAQMRTGSVMRPSVPGTVSIGSLKNRVEDKAAAEKLTNPLVGDKDSPARGKRLFSANCSPCHANIEANPYVMSEAAKKGMAGPNLSEAPYDSRTDGNIYGTIHFGGMALMPGYGWKLSPTEHWDIINYIRVVQKAKAKK